MTEKYPAHKILKDNPPFSIPKRYTSFDKGDEAKSIEKLTYDSRDLIAEFAQLEAENKRLWKNLECYLGQTKDEILKTWQATSELEQALTKES